MFLRLLMLASSMLLGGCTASGARDADTAQVAPGKVDGDTARQLVNDGAKLVDVRPAPVYDEWHIAGAINLPFAQLAARAAELGPHTTPLVLYCQTGATSARAAAQLRAMGYTKVYDLGSYVNWRDEAQAPAPPLAAGPGAPDGGAP